MECFATRNNRIFHFVYFDVSNQTYFAFNYRGFYRINEIPCKTKAENGVVFARNTLSVLYKYSIDLE